MDAYFVKQLMATGLVTLLCCVYTTQAQSSDTCSIVEKDAGKDTITVRVKYLSWTMNIAEQGTAAQQDFYGKMKKQYGLQYDILCQPLSCDSLFSLPIITKPEWEGYFFKLADNRKPILRCGQVLEITMVRYPAKRTGTGQPFLVIIHFKPTATILPVQLTPYMQQLHNITRACEE